MTERAVEFNAVATVRQERAPLTDFDRHSRIAAATFIASFPVMAVSPALSLLLLCETVRRINLANKSQ